MENGPFEDVFPIYQRVSIPSGGELRWGLGLALKIFHDIYPDRSISVFSLPCELCLCQVVSPDTVVEQEARPTGCMWYPYCGGKGDNQKVLTMNDEYKFKIWNTVTWFFSNDAAGFFSVFFHRRSELLPFLLPSGVIFFGI